MSKLSTVRLKYKYFKKAPSLFCKDIRFSSFSDIVTGSYCTQASVCNETSCTEGGGP